MPPPVKLLAIDLGLPVLQPPTLKEEGFRSNLTDMAADVIVVVAFRILPRSVLAIPEKGAVNLHPSLLPRYRGAAPIRHCLMAGETITGVTTTMMTMDIDAGNILLQQRQPIEPEDDYGALSRKLAQLGAEVLTASLDQLGSGELTPRPQEQLPSGREYAAPKIKPEDWVIQWERSARDISNQVRAFSPTPGATTLWQGRRLKLFRPGTRAETGEPGVVQGVNEGRLRIGTGDGVLEVEELQIEGRRRMSVEAFLKGTTFEAGTAFG